MATLSFSGETHDEIVDQVRVWLASAQKNQLAESAITAVDAAAHMTRDALTIIAEAAPESVAGGEVVQALVKMGHDGTEVTRASVVSALDALADVTGGSLVKRLERARNSVAYEMNSAIAKQVLKSLTPRR